MMTVKAVKNSIVKLEIRCTLLRNCDWRGTLTSAERLLDACLNFIIQCSQCTQVFPRGEKVQHKGICPMRVIHCQYCEKQTVAREMNEHLTFCFGCPIYCPIRCGASL